MRLVLALTLVAGCRFAPAAAGDAPAADGPQDGPVDAPTPDGPAMPDGPFDCMTGWKSGAVQLGGTTALNVNSPTADDRDPWLSDNEQTLYYSSNRPGGKGAFDIWFARRPALDQPFGSVSNSGSLDSNQDESKLSMAGSALYLVFASSRPGGAGGSSDLWVATRTDTGKAFGGLNQTDLLALETNGNELDPWLSDDALDLYYASVGSSEVLEHASRASTLVPFGSPQELTELTSGKNDGDPTLSTDALVIIFSSGRDVPAGSPQLGGTNLWYATRTATDQPFGAPQLVPGVSSDQDDADPHLSDDGCRLYFSSDRAGSYDLYVATVQP